MITANVNQRYALYVPVTAKKNHSGRGKKVRGKGHRNGSADNNRSFHIQAGAQVGGGFCCLRCVFPHDPEHGAQACRDHAVLPQNISLYAAIAL